MKGKLPSGSRAEQVEFARNLKRQDDLERPRVRMTRAKRRVAVAGLVLVILATSAWVVALATRVVTGNRAMGIVYFLLAAQALLFVLLIYSVGDLTAGDSSLDERERLQRDHATAVAYRILTVVIAALSVLAIVANTAFGWLPQLNLSMGVAPFLMPFIWFVGCLPIAVIAWTLPDPEVDS